jgi:hypothetical protein
VTLAMSHSGPQSSFASDLLAFIVDVLKHH